MNSGFRVILVVWWLLFVQLGFLKQRLSYELSKILMLVQWLFIKLLLVWFLLQLTLDFVQIPALTISRGCCCCVDGHSAFLCFPRFCPLWCSLSHIQQKVVSHWWDSELCGADHLWGCEDFLMCQELSWVNPGPGEQLQEFCHWRQQSSDSTPDP